MKTLEKYIAEKLVINKNTKIAQINPINKTTWVNGMTGVKRWIYEYFYESTDAEKVINDLLLSMTRTNKTIKEDDIKKSDLPILAVQKLNGTILYNIGFEDDKNVFKNIYIINPYNSGKTVFAYINTNSLKDLKDYVSESGKTIYCLHEDELNSILECENYIMNTAE